MRKSNKGFYRKLVRLCRHFRFGDMPVKTKLVLCFLFVFAVMIFLSAISFSYYKLDKQESTFTTIHQMNIQTINKIEDYLEDIKRITVIPVSSAFNNTEYKFLDEMDLFNTTGMPGFSLIKLIRQLSFNTYNLKSSINSVFFFNLQGSSISEQNESYLNGVFNPKDTDWFNLTKKLLGKPVIVRTFLIPISKPSSSEYKYVFAVARGLVKVTGGKLVGVVLITSDIDFFGSLCRKMIIVPNQRIIIADTDGYTIYDTVQENITKQLDKNLFQTAGTDDSKDRSIKLDGISYLASIQSFSATGWKIINLVPVNELNKNINKLWTPGIVITVIMIFACVLFAVFISSRIVGPIKKLALMMKVVEKGDFDIRNRFTARDEVGQLGRSFNVMTGKIKKLVEEVYIDKIKQKELELQMLQNQINPHFLYNTLESIRMMAEVNRDKSTSMMARALGRILRYGINLDNDRVTVREELDCLQEYVMLQKVRFENMFDIIVNVDDDIYDIIIIKLILQPLVENAIYHGLEGRSEGGRIEVTGCRDGEDIVFEVIDNGKGMDEEQVLKINGYINDMNNSFKSIGIKNVNKRIQLYYGGLYGVKISSKPGEGTKVTVLLKTAIN